MTGAFKTVSASVFSRFLAYAANAGAIREKLLDITGVSREALIDPDARIGFDIYQNLVKSSIELASRPTLALEYPFSTGLDTASIVGLIIKSSKSLTDAFTQLNRYAKLMMEIDIMAGQERHPIIVNDDAAWILDARPDPNSFYELTEIALGRIIGETRALFPERTFAELVTVTHEEPPYSAEYSRLWQCPIEFGATQNAVKFDPSWLSVEFDAANAYAFGVFAEKAETLTQKLQQSSKLRHKIEAHLLPDLHRGLNDIDKVSRQLGMSRSTLYRNLKTENITFAEIVDDLRRKKAIEYLSSRKVSIKETAYLVGFSEASSFNRAFKRWTGQSPKAFRREGY